MGILIKWSKTNQFGSRLLKAPLVAIPDSVLCPVQVYTKLIKATPVLPDDPVFVVRTEGVLKPIIYRQLQTKIKLLIGKTGRDPTHFASHSIRRGGFSWTFKAGVPTNLIQHHWDWLSNCHKKYLTFDFREKLSVSETMAIKIIKREGN